MRVAILADPIDNQNAGIHVYTREMVAAMIRTNPGHELILIREKIDSAIKGVTQIAVPNIRLPIGFASLRLFLIVPFILHQKKVNVVIEPAHFGPFNLIRRIKRITIIHDLTPIIFPELHRWHSQLLQKIFLKGILNKTDTIITNSENTSKDLCKVYPANCNKVKRIYPGISSLYEPDSNTAALNKYKITNPYFLFVGTIEPRKNLIVLLEAFQKFKEENNSTVQLVIAGGNGWKSETFFEALNKHPFREHILLTGFVLNEELPSLYTHAIAVIYPSLYEGFGLPVAEAMCCGTPVIASNNSSIPEAGGDGAIYFDSANVNELATQMLKIFTDPELRKNLSQKAKTHAAKFSWDKFANQFWKEIEHKD